MQYVEIAREKATPAGFETEGQPNLRADLRSRFAKLGVPLGSGEITWRHQKSVRFGPALAQERAAPNRDVSPLGSASMISDTLD